MLSSALSSHVFPRDSSHSTCSSPPNPCSATSSPQFQKPYYDLLPQGLLTDLSLFTSLGSYFDQQSPSDRLRHSHPPRPSFFDPHRSFSFYKVLHTISAPIFWTSAALIKPIHSSTFRSEATIPLTTQSPWSSEPTPRAIQNPPTFISRLVCSLWGSACEQYSSNSPLHFFRVSFLIPYQSL